MAYDAFVPCDCFERGLAKPPPFEVNWNAIDGLWEVNADESDEAFYQLLKWQEAACEHARMRLVDVRLANISGMAHLRATADKLGLSHLRAELPTANGGFIALEKIPAILPELDFLEEFPTLQTYLLDEEGNVLWDIAGTEDFWIGGQWEWSFGLGGKGVYVWAGNDELFRSRLFRQELHPTQQGRAIYHAEDREASIEQGHLFTVDDGRIPAKLRVVSEERPAEISVWQAQTLRTLCQAALQVGKPIYWY